MALEETALVRLSASMLRALSSVLLMMMTKERMREACISMKKVSRRDWNLNAKVTASDGEATDYFGSSVSIDGDVMIVGSSRDDDTGSSSGSAYGLRESGWCLGL